MAMAMAGGPETLESVPGSFGLQVVDVVGRFRVTATELLAPFGLDEAQLEDPKTRLPVPVYGALLERARQLTQEPGFGFYLGLHRRATLYGFLGFAAMHAETLGEALELAAQFGPTIVTGSSIRLHVEGETAALTIEGPAPEQWGGAHDIAVISLLMGLVTIGQAVTGKELPGAGEVTISEPAYFARFAHLLPGLRFEQPMMRLLFAASHLQLPLWAPDRAAVKLARQRCEAELRELGLGVDIVDRTRRLVLTLDHCSLENVAAELHVSCRTLKRRLAERNTTFSTLKEQVRRDRALLLLQADSVRIDSIAERLGYSTLPNFVRAFRRWTGTTPAAYRQQLREPAPAK